MLKEETKKLQHDLAWYCRDGKLIELKGVRQDRLHHYRRLVYNVMYGILSKAFPVVKSVLSEAEFKSLLNEFFIAHNAQTPEVWKVPGEFYQFVNTHPGTLQEAYPFLTDLIYMEWMEIYVFNKEEIPTNPHSGTLPIDNDKVVLNPDHVVLNLSFPVFKGDWEHILTKKGSYHLLIFRNNETKKVQFMEISGLHLRLIDIFKSETTSLGSMFDKALEDFSLEVSADNKKRLGVFIEKLYNDGFILGAGTAQ